MKTSEFIEKLDEHKDKVLKVYQEYDEFETTIKTDQFSITYRNDEEPNGILDIIAEYLNTPVEEREDEKKYKLKQKGVSNRYLIWIPEIDKFTTGNSQYVNVESVFTQEEIDNLPECYTHPAVWEQIEVESEENEQL